MRPRRRWAGRCARWPCSRWPRWSLAMADPHRPEYDRRAHRQAAPRSCSLLDRSRSMDQGFAGAAPRAPVGRGNGPEALDYYFSQRRPGCAIERQGRAPAAGRVRRQAPARPLRADRLQHAADPGARIHAEGRRDSGRDRRRQRRPRAVGDQHRPRAGARAGRCLRRPAVHRLAHRDAGVRRRRPPRPRHPRAHRRAARKHACRVYWLYLRSAQQPGAAADQASRRRRRDRSRD